jgi:predicted RNA-binding Zn ribbon-like protein
VVFGHDTEASLLAAVALVNSAVQLDGETDELTSVADLERFFSEHRYTGRFDRTSAELDAVRALRPRLRELLTADRDTAAHLVNVLLAEAQAVPRLVRHAGADWHIHAVDDDAPLPVRILVETAMAMSDVIRADEMSRLATCAADDCDDVVLDLSRNRSRRFCSTQCSNREAVAAYRRRRRGVRGSASAPR